MGQPGSIWPGRSGDTTRLLLILSLKQAEAWGSRKGYLDTGAWTEELGVTSL